MDKAEFTITNGGCVMQGCFVGTQGNVDPENTGPYVALLAAVIKQAHKDLQRPLRKRRGQANATAKEKQEAAEFLQWCAEQFV